jgi:hypothetical protein
MSQNMSIEKMNKAFYGNLNLLKDFQRIRLVRRSLWTGVETKIKRGLAAAILQAMVRREVRRRGKTRMAQAIEVLQKTYRGHLCRRSVR